MNGRLYYGSKSLVLCSLHMCQCWVSFNVQQPFSLPPLTTMKFSTCRKLKELVSLKSNSNFAWHIDSQALVFYQGAMFFTFK